MTEEFYDVRTEHKVTQPSGVFGEARWHSHPPREQQRKQPSELGPQTLAGILAYRGKDISSFSLWRLLTDAKNAPDKPIEERNYAYAQLDKLERIADVMRDIGYRLPGGNRAYLDEEETLDYSQNHVNRGRSHVTVDLPRAVSRRRVPLGTTASGGGSGAEDKDAYGTFVRVAKKYEIDGVISQLKCVMGKIRQTTELTDAHQQAITAFEADEAYEATKSRELAPRMVIHENRVATGRNMHGEVRYWPSVATDPFFTERDPVHNWGIHIPSGVFVCCGQRVASGHPGCFIDTFSATDNQSRPARLAQRRFGDGMTGQKWIQSYTRGTAYLDEEKYYKMHNEILDALKQLDVTRLDAAFRSLTVQETFSVLGVTELTKLINLFRRLHAYNAYRRNDNASPVTSLEWARFLSFRVFGLTLPLSLQEPIPPRLHETEFDVRVLAAITETRIALIPSVPSAPVVPSVPSTPVVSVPSAPVVPSVPSVPSAPVAPVPSVPSAPVVPVVPSVPSVPSAPAVPSVPSAPVPSSVSPSVPSPVKVTIAVASELAMIRNSPGTIKGLLSEATRVRTDAQNKFAGKVSPTLKSTLDGLDDAVKDVQDLFDQSTNLAESTEFDIAKGAIDDTGVETLAQQAEKLIQAALQRRRDANILVTDEEAYQQFLLDVDTRAAEIRRVLSEAVVKATDASSASVSKLPDATAISDEANALQAALRATENDVRRSTGVSGVEQVAFYSDLSDDLLGANQLLARATALASAPVPGSVPSGATGTVKKDPAAIAPVPTATFGSPPISVKKEPATPAKPSTEKKIVLPASPNKRIDFKVKDLIDNSVLRPLGISVLNRSKRILEQLDTLGPIVVPTLDGTATESISMWAENGRDFKSRTLNSQVLDPILQVIGTPVKVEDSDISPWNYNAMKDNNVFNLNARQRKYLFEGSDAPAREILLLRSFNKRPLIIVQNWMVLDESPNYSPEGHAYKSKTPDTTAEDSITIFRGSDDKGAFRQRMGLIGRAWANFVAILIQIATEPLASANTAKEFRDLVAQNKKIADARANIKSGVDKKTGFIVLQKMDAGGGGGGSDAAYAVPLINVVDAKLIAAEEAFLLGENVAPPEQALIEQLASSGAVRPEEIAVFARLRSNKRNSIRAIAQRMKDFERNQTYVLDYDKQGVPTRLNLERIETNLLSEFFAYVARSGLFSREQLKTLRLANENGRLYQSISDQVISDKVLDVADMTVQELIDLIHSWAPVADVIVLSQDSSPDARKAVKEAIDALFEAPSAEPATGKGIGSWFDWA